MVIVFCFACLSFLTFGDPDDTRLNDTLATGFIALLFSTVGSYVFGAVWHDRGLMQAEVESGRSPYGEELDRVPPGTKEVEE